MGFGTLGSCDISTGGAGWFGTAISANVLCDDSSVATLNILSSDPGGGGAAYIPRLVLFLHSHQLRTAAMSATITTGTVTATAIVVVWLLSPPLDKVVFDGKAAVAVTGAVLRVDDVGRSVA